MTRTLSTLWLVALAVAASPAQAQQQWPFSFDAGLAPDSSTVETNLALGALSLPPLPVSELQTLVTNDGTMTLYFWPQNAELLNNLLISGDAGPMDWPATPVLCAQTAAFTLPVLLPSDAGAACAKAASQIQTDLSAANLMACLLIEQPELYVYGYSPSDYQTDVTSIEGMIGLAGEALTHGQLPPAGVLPDDFVSELRVAIDKVRQTTLDQDAQTTAAALADAQSALTANAACFGATTTSQLGSQIGEMEGELTAASDYLGGLVDGGTQQAAQEEVCLAATSRVRASLPFPSMTQADREFLAFWLGGMYWRMRGGGLIPTGSTQDARLYFVDDAFTQIGTLVGGSDGAAVANPFWVEVIVDGWSQWMVMDSGDGGTRYDNLIGMTERGQRQANSGVNALKGYDGGDLLTGGLQMGPGYYWGWWGVPDYRFDDAMTSPYGNLIDGPTAIGEFNTGAALGLGLARVTLAGKPTGSPPTVTLCAGQQCGNDGCGGSCGTCPASETCNAVGQCVAAPVDAGSPLVDAGPPPTDAGVAVDAGAPPPVDAGSPTLDAGEPDAGEPGEPDAGEPDLDAGVTPPMDAGGLQENDAGMVEPPDAGGPVDEDAGTTVPDAGEVAADAGVRPAPDAGHPSVDAGSSPSAPADAGATKDSATAAGCGCGGSSRASLLDLLVALGLAMGLRRRAV